MAVGVKANFEDRLLELPSVVDYDGRQIIPPLSDSPNALSTVSSPLAEKLGIVTLLHRAHLGRGRSARTVLNWLRESGALLDSSDDRAVIHRLAAAGKSEGHIAVPLSDEGVQTLRKAFELLDPAEQREVGPDLGSAVLLDAYTFEVKGRRKLRREISVRPVDAYLPRTIDRDTDSFSVAADKSPGLVWLDDRYARLLRSSVGTKGVGPRRFLRLLGAETVPRLRPHPHLVRRYADVRLGLPDLFSGGLVARIQAMQERGATYTLQDCDSPDLRSVVREISSMGRSRQRRRRAGAILAALSRAWDRHLSDFAEVDSALDSYGWINKGPISAFWVWETSHVAWLDDETGTPRRPSELQLRTPGTVAIYGEDSPDYLHPDLYHPSRRAALGALGVSGDPSRSELVARLRDLRYESEDSDDHSIAELKQETAVLYKALAQTFTIEGSSSSDMRTNELRREFQRHSLVLTNLGWHTPQNVLAGNPIFGKYRAFAPAVAGTDPLWETLGLRSPSPRDCREIVRMIAKQPGLPSSDDETVLLETLRALASHPETGSTPQARGSLARLPLWTSKGWMRVRPVYAADDPVLAEGLRAHIPIWEPGGELEQFRSLIEWLHIEEIRSADAELIDPNQSSQDPVSTDFFRSALEQLQEDLGRNDPRLAEGMKISWDSLLGYSVQVHPSLTLRVTIPIGGTDGAYEMKVAARVDNDRRIFFVRSFSDLPLVDGGGRTLATLFEGDSRRLAQAWRAACDRADTGVELEPIELADQRARREREQNESDLEGRTAAFQSRVVEKHRAVPRSSRRGAAAGTSLHSAANERGEGEEALGLPLTRVLVDPQSLTLVNAHGQIVEGSSITRSRNDRNRSLVEPRPGSSSPRNRVPLRGYSDSDRETVGMELLKMLLGSEDEEIADLRSRRNVGADAVNVVGELLNFFELKVSAGDEPDIVTLTKSEVRRALSTKDFFLVVVSGVEGSDAKPQVRVIVDPLEQLNPTDSGSITLSGVRNAKSIVYGFARNDETAPARE